MEISRIGTPTTQALRERLGEPRRWVVADLTCGAWAGRTAAAQLCTQLDIRAHWTTDPPPDSWTTDPHEWRYAQVIAESIDREAAGDRIVIAAAVAARSVATALYARPDLDGCAVVLPTPTSTTGLTRFDNEFLAELGRWQTCPLHFLDWSADAACPPQATVSPVALVPGVLEPCLAAAVAGARDRDGLVESASGALVVGPELRRTAAAASQLDFDRLAAAPGDPSLTAYAQRYGSAYFAQPELLCRQGWSELAEHHEEGAIELVAHAVRSARTPLERAICAAQLGGMAIALRRFELASALTVPHGVPGELRGFLRQCRGWGLVMSGDPAGALVELDAAAADLAGWTDRVEYLYLLNITALAALRSGDPGRALALEQRIDTTIKRSATRDDRLGYVNDLNLARLYRRRGESVQAGRHYAAAFATTRGTGTPHDVLHAEVCRAYIEGQQGQDAAAASSWLRAAILWAALRFPRALGQRVAAAITGIGKLGDPIDPAAVSAALLQRLGGSEPTYAGLAVPDILWADGDDPERCADGVYRFVPDAVTVCADGWAVAMLPPGAGSASPDATADEGMAALRRIIAARLRAAAPLLGPGWTGGSIVVDDRLRRGLPRDRVGALESALRLGIRRIVVDGVEIHIDDACAAWALQRSRVRLGAGVAAVDGQGSACRVAFRRYRQPLVLSGAPVAVLKAVRTARAPTVADVAADAGLDPDSAVSVLRRLEHDRVVELLLDLDTCEQVLGPGRARVASEGGGS